MKAEAVLELTPGTEVVLDGREWTVERREPHLGRVHLVSGDGARQQVSLRFLACHPDCWPSSRTSAEGAGRGRQPRTPGDLKPGRRELAGLRMAHLMEVETGYRSGSPLRALPGEPRPGYDPAVTTLHERRLAKVAEMAALGADSAAMLGLARISERTLVRWAGQCRRSGIAGCIDGHWLRRGGGRYSVTGQLREAIYAVRAEACTGRGSR